MKKQKFLVQAISPFPTMFSAQRHKLSFLLHFICRLQMLSIWSGPKFCWVGMGQILSKEKTSTTLSLSLPLSHKEDTRKYVIYLSSLSIFYKGDWLTGCTVITDYSSHNYIGTYVQGFTLRLRHFEKCLAKGYSDEKQCVSARLESGTFMIRSMISVHFSPESLRTPNISMDKRNCIVSNDTF